MGYMQKLSCSCGYKANLRLGSGRWLPDAEDIQSNFPAEKLTEFNAALKIGILGKPFYIENIMSCCSHCKDIKEGRALHFQIRGKEKTVFDLCPTCGRELEPVEDGPLCPKCGKPLQEEMTGFWD